MAPAGPTPRTTPMSTSTVHAALSEHAAERILVFDGAMGTMVQTFELDEAEFRGERFTDHSLDLRGNADVLSLTRPELVASIHDRFLAAGADLLTTNTFNANAIAQADYGLETSVGDLNRAAAQLAKAACAEWSAQTPGQPRFAAGSPSPANGRCKTVPSHWSRLRGICSANPCARRCCAPGSGRS